MVQFSDFNSFIRGNLTLMFMLYTIFQYDWEKVLIQRKFIGLEAILENDLLFSPLHCFQQPFLFGSSSCSFRFLQFSNKWNIGSSALHGKMFQVTIIPKNRWTLTLAIGIRGPMYSLEYPRSNNTQVKLHWSKNV